MLVEESGTGCLVSEEGSLKEAAKTVKKIIEWKLYCNCNSSHLLL